jgi:hypothetical protein
MCFLNVSPTNTAMEYKNVSTREWADQIRAIKLRELQELIKNKQEVVPYIDKIDANSSVTGQSALLWLKRKVLGDVSRLKNKFELLIKKS